MSLLRTTLVLLTAFWLFSCSSTMTQPKNADTKDKQPPEPPKQPEETFWRCTVLNGEGRTFVVQDKNSFIAEGKAKRDCQLSYRNCMLLKCDQVSE